MAVGALEQRFYNEFVELLGIADEIPARKDFERWDELRDAVAARFRTKTRAGVDGGLRGVRRLCGARCCRCVRHRTTPISRRVAPSPTTRGITQPAPAPRFSATPGSRAAAARAARRGRCGDRPRLGPARRQLGRARTGTGIPHAPRP